MKRMPGFTIIELLVVIIIIVVLATITIFGFGAWRERTTLSQMNHEISSTNDAINHYETFNNALPASTATLQTLYQKDNSLTLTYTPRVDGKTYCLKVDDGTGASLPSLYYNSTNGQTSTTVCT